MFGTICSCAFSECVANLWAHRQPAAEAEVVRLHQRLSLIQERWSQKARLAASCCQGRPCRSTWREAVGEVHAAACMHKQETFIQILRPGNTTLRPSGMMVRSQPGILAGTSNLLDLFGHIRLSRRADRMLCCRSKISQSPARAPCLDRPGLWHRAVPCAVDDNQHRPQAARTKGWQLSTHMRFGSSAWCKS